MHYQALPPSPRSVREKRGLPSYRVLLLRSLLLYEVEDGHDDAARTEIGDHASCELGALRACRPARPHPFGSSAVR